MVISTIILTVATPTQTTSPSNAGAGKRKKSRRKYNDAGNR